MSQNRLTPVEATGIRKFIRLEGLIRIACNDRGSSGNTAQIFDQACDGLPKALFLVILLGTRLVSGGERLIIDDLRAAPNCRYAVLKVSDFNAVRALLELWILGYWGWSFPRLWR